MSVSQGLVWLLQAGTRPTELDTFLLGGTSGPQQVPVAVLVLSIELHPACRAAVALQMLLAKPDGQARGQAAKVATPCPGVEIELQQGHDCMIHRVQECACLGLCC